MTDEQFREVRAEARLALMVALFCLFGGIVAIALSLNGMAPGTR